MMSVGDIMSTLGDVQYTGDIMSTPGVCHDERGGYPQYTGGYQGACGELS